MSKKKSPPCRKNFTYSNRDDAIPHRNRLIQRNVGLLNLNIYHCPEHGGWHVGRKTSKPYVRRQRVRV